MAPALSPSVPDWDQAARTYPPPPSLARLAGAYRLHPADLHARVLVIQNLALQHLAAVWDDRAARLLTPSQVTGLVLVQQRPLSALQACAQLGASDSPRREGYLLRRVFEYLAGLPEVTTPPGCGCPEAGPACRTCEQYRLYHAWLRDAHITPSTTQA